MSQTCPKCGSSVLYCKWKGLSTPFEVDYVECGNGVCTWDNLEEQKSAKRVEYPEFSRPVWATMKTCETCNNLETVLKIPFCRRVLHQIESKAQSPESFPLIVTISLKEVDSFLAVPLDFGCNRWEPKE